MGCIHIAVQHAVVRGDDRMLKLLLSHGCPADERDDERNTGLHEVARCSQRTSDDGASSDDASAANASARAVAVVELLVSSGGADVKATNLAGETPLQVAVTSGNVAVADALRARDVDTR